MPWLDENPVLCPALCRCRLHPSFAQSSCLLTILRYGRLEDQWRKPLTLQLPLWASSRGQMLLPRSASSSAEGYQFRFIPCLTTSCTVQAS